jgi:signal transduction histidine kinase
VDLASLTRQIATEFEPAMASAGLRFVVDCPPLPRPVRIDRSVWETIVPNLLSNALKYTTHGSVTLRLQAIEGRVRLVVQDTGAGIPTASLPHVFKRFYRAPESAARSIEGTGIGLALVRELVHALGGDVDVASEPGVGSTFTVEIPFDGAPAPAAASAERAATSGAGTAAFVQEAVGWMEPRSAPPEEPPRSEPPQSRSRVLVVEDNPDMRQYLVQVLRRDYQVRAVADGQAALEAIAASRPDLVLSDIVMPGLDGLALVRAIRDDSSTRAIPVILVTARAGEDAALEGLGGGADDYVVKPFSSRELLARVQTRLELARVRREAGEAAMKEAFVGVVSHELRTPLTSIKFQAQLLAGQTAKGAHLKGAGSLEVLQRGVARMERLVDDLLSLSAIKSGTFTVRPERADLVSICSSAAQEQSVIAKREVSLDLPPARVLACVDSQRIQQAVGNLLSNALRYSPRDRPVTLRLRGTGTEAIVSVRDEGPGIPPEALPHLFERFYRVPGLEGSGGSPTGLGLGLYVSHAIVERHGGRIEIQSQRGRGSTFSVHLPLAGRSTEARVP